ncbi:MAG: hypothetical protein ACLUJM_08870 [Finegoldia sp.]|uniref:hypothetical protein n=1 Tax=Finegoldia sp. TaxID=1981334 RepID=UPI003990FFA6
MDGLFFYITDNTQAFTRENEPYAYTTKMFEQIQMQDYFPYLIPSKIVRKMFDNEDPYSKLLQNALSKIQNDFSEKVKDNTLASKNKASITFKTNISNLTNKILSDIKNSTLNPNADLTLFVSLKPLTITNRNIEQTIAFCNRFNLYNIPIEKYKELVEIYINIQKKSTNSYGNNLIYYDLVNITDLEYLNSDYFVEKVKMERDYQQRVDNTEHLNKFKNIVGTYNADLKNKDEGGLFLIPTDKEVNFDKILKQRKISPNDLMYIKILPNQELRSNELGFVLRDNNLIYLSKINDTRFEEIKQSSARFIYLVYDRFYKLTYKDIQSLSMKQIIDPVTRENHSEIIENNEAKYLVNGEVINTDDNSFSNKLIENYKKLYIKTNFNNVIRNNKIDREALLRLTSSQQNSIKINSNFLKWQIYYQLQSKDDNSIQDFGSIDISSRFNKKRLQNQFTAAFEIKDIIKMKDYVYPSDLDNIICLINLKLNKSEYQKVRLTEKKLEEKIKNFDSTNDADSKEKVREDIINILKDPLDIIRSYTLTFEYDGLNRKFRNYCSNNKISTRKKINKVYEDEVFKIYPIFNLFNNNVIKTFLNNYSNIQLEVLNELKKENEFYKDILIKKENERNILYGFKEFSFKEFVCENSDFYLYLATQKQMKTIEDREISKAKNDLLNLPMYNGGVWQNVVGISDLKDKINDNLLNINNRIVNDEYKIIYINKILEITGGNTEPVNSFDNMKIAIQNKSQAYVNILNDYINISKFFMKDFLVNNPDIIRFKKDLENIDNNLCVYFPDLNKVLNYLLNNLNKSLFERNGVYDPNEKLESIVLDISKSLNELIDDVATSDVSTNDISTLITKIRTSFKSIDIVGSCKFDKTILKLLDVFETYSTPSISSIIKKYKIYESILKTTSSLQFNLNIYVDLLTRKQDSIFYNIQLYMNIEKMFEEFKRSGISGYLDSYMAQRKEIV